MDIHKRKCDEDIERLQAEIDTIRKAVRGCFGKSPMSCDGIISVPVGKYYELVRLLKEGE
jgi:hypothetical protein